MRLSARSVAATLAATLLVGLLPAAASAQMPVARVVLYEVWEALEFRGPIKKADPEAYRRRFAEAGLLGLKPEPFTNGVFGLADGVVAEATSNVNIDPRSRQFGTGPIRGEFQLLKFIDPAGPGDLAPNLADLVVMAEGRLQGTLDLRLAINEIAPLAPVSGTWQLAATPVQGHGPLAQLRGLRGLAPGNKRFEGVFLIPVSIPNPLDPAGPPVTFYVVPAELLAQGAVTCSMPLPFEPSADTVACALEPGEFLMNFALTKAVIVLFE